MNTPYHRFFIPVMGTGHSADTPLRVAPLGISSVVSLVDDLLLQELGTHYADQVNLPYPSIARHAEDGRARRITAYLNLLEQIVRQRFQAIQAQPFAPDTDKTRYFDLLPDDLPLKRAYQRFLTLPAGAERAALAAELTTAMRPGDIDVNIMVKVDRLNYDAHGRPLGDLYRDAMAALRGYANSVLSSALVLSAGINQALYAYLTQFPDFYPDASGRTKKRIVVKVSDFRSARIQGKYLARKGLVVSEYRIESGLNCGGHAFPTDGQLLPEILRQFAEHPEQLVFAQEVTAYFQGQGWDPALAATNARPLITVQGGLGTSGEAQRLTDDLGADQTGWASPFLLVPQATCVDEATRQMLERAGPSDLYVSNASPLGIPFNNLRSSPSEANRRRRIDRGKPGSPCPKGFARLNTDFGEPPLCIASRSYQRQRLAQIEASDLPAEEKRRSAIAVTEKSCICDHLGNGARIALGLAQPEQAPPAICPGPNLVWFDRSYALREMVDHIYGRIASLLPAQRPHIFAQELALYVEHAQTQLAAAALSTSDARRIAKLIKNLRHSLDVCRDIAQRAAFPNENLASLSAAVAQQSLRLDALSEKLRLLSNQPMAAIG